MTNKLVLTTSALIAMFGNFALTGPAHAEIFVCGAFQCEQNPTSADGASIYESGTVCWVGSGQTGGVNVADLRSCVEGVSGKPSVSLHVRAQGASGRGVTTWNGGLAVTQFPFGSQLLFPENGGNLHYTVGRQPATAQDGDGLLLPRPNNASFVAIRAIRTLSNYVVLAGGGGSKGRIRESSGGPWPTTSAGDGRWSTTSAGAGRGGWAFGQSTVGLCTTGPQDDVCDAGDPGGDDGSAGGGGGGGDLKGGAAGFSPQSPNVPSEGGWGEFYGPAAYGAQDSAGNFLMVGGEGGQGDGGGGGGGFYSECSFMCVTNSAGAAAGGGGGSRALRTSIQQNLPIFAEEARVELVFNHSSP